MKEYIIYTIIVLLGLQLQAQTVLSDKNYIHTTTPQSSFTEEQLNSIDNTTLETSKKNIERVTYFDGLGRPMQQIAIRGGIPSTDVRNNNELPMDWTEGEGSTPFFNQNGETLENIRTMGLDPFGKESLLWFCNNDVKSDADGGWNTDYFAIDINIAYRYTVWVKRTISQSGITYHGTQNVSDLNGNADSNPYFWHGDLPELDTWYLLVGVIHPQDYTGSDQGVSGVYDIKGNKVLDGKEFKWMNDTSSSRFRSYLYYSIDNNSKQYFWNPIVQKINGSENVLKDFTQPNIIGIPKDIVTHVEYDEYGRQSKNYLPFTSNEASGVYKSVNINSDINDYYLNKYRGDFPGITSNLGDVNAYSENIFEASPLNRVTEKGAPGKSWKANPNSNNDHTIKFDWESNIVDEVVYFKVVFTGDNTEKPSLIKDGHYPAGELYVAITKDENWQPDQIHSNDHTTKEYSDKLGRVVLKRSYNENIVHDTYYVYDDYGNLTYVITPKVIVTDGVSIEELNELCYQYKYDYKNRLIEKKIPGKGKEYIIYNTLDQPVLTQDANLRAKSRWLFTKYDVFGRIAYTGLIENGSTVALLRSKTSSSSYRIYETKTTSPTTIAGTPVYYTKDAYPVSMYKVLKINYYDNYNFDINGLANPGTVYEKSINLNTKSLPTGIKVRVLDTNDWITTIPYYDNKGRPIYIANENEYLNTIDITENKLDFIGNVEETRTTHTKSNDISIVTIDKFEYDHIGRLLIQTQQIGTQDIEQIISNTYDALGQLESKAVGGNVTASGSAAASPLQNVNYTYNIRGWLKAINEGITANEDLFGFALDYNTGTNPLYNGNIASTSWQTKSINPSLPNNPISNTYSYTYDPLNRLISATDNTGNYTVSGITYDKTGNILSLNRAGHLNTNTTSFGDMDILAYDYDTGNKLRKVVDTGDKTFGFKDGTNTNDDFKYDTNGNMVLDRNKGITGVTYNHLNLPKIVTINNQEHTGNINYIYDATGVKLKKIATDGSSLTTTTEYAGKYIYKNGILEFFNHPEGYVEKDATGYNYVYQFKDHNENIRLSYKDANGDGIITQDEIIEENNYYPFGLRHRGYNNTIRGSKNDYLTYNGKEQVKELNLNLIEMDWRQFNPDIGRFISIDPLANDSYQVDLTPYNFAWNNPILYNDPSGLCPECPDVEDYETGDAYYVNGTKYIVDNDGQWAREGGSLGEVVINSDGTDSESASSENNETMSFFMSYGGKVAPSIGDLRGWSKFSAEAQVNMPWLFGKRKSDDGKFFVDPSGNSIGVVPIGAPVNLPFGPGNATTVAAESIHFMQSSIKNTTGSYTVLGNAKALASGKLNPEVLRISVWKDANGKIWTLDHRRLAAFKLSGAKEVPVSWATSSQVRSQMWKMSTRTNGTTIRLKLGDGKNMIIK